MKNRKMIRFLALFALCGLLSGCVMTVDQMYRIPKRSERYEDLQVKIDEAMKDMVYSAPVSGENRQTVQTADLDGDGKSEIIVFAKANDEDPMKLLIFSPTEESDFELKYVLDSTGTAFDQVEYAQMDGQPGMELIVGHQLSDQVLRNVSVYSFSSDGVRMLLNANYSKFMNCDLNTDGCSDLFLIHPAEQAEENAVAVVYSVSNGEVVRSVEAELSVPVENLKRIITGTLESGEQAVYVASKAGEESLLTDIFALVDGNLKNVSLSSEAGASVQTLRNYYVYADDIDRDGVIELPELIPMPEPATRSAQSSQHLIRWYSVCANGETVTKRYTYHNFVDGWYVELEEDYSRRIRVDVDASGGYRFYLCGENDGTSELLFTVYTLTGEQRMDVAQQEELQELIKTDHVVYAARMEEGFSMGIDDLRKSFHLIQVYWKTGEM